MTRTRSYYYLYAKPPEIEHKPGPRKCLRCRKDFKSQGIGNRICHYCRNYRLKGYEDETRNACHVAFAEVPLSDMETYW